MMQPRCSRPRRDVGSGVVLSLALLLATACSDSESPSARDAGVEDGATDSGLGADDAAIRDGSTTDASDGGTPHARGPATIPLGTAAELAQPGSYVLLAKTGISNGTGSMISGGHVGLSPAASSFITGFSLIADPSNVYSTSASVVPPGKVYAADGAVPTPANLTSAVLAMEAAYTDGAGRSNPDFLDLSSGDIGGQTLVAGLYTWGGGVTVPADVTLSGGGEDVWIFQIAGDLDVSTAKNVILSGGARARNVFWVVAGQATIHANAHFEGVILSQTGITLQTNASLHGRALAQSLVALDDNAVTAP